MSRFRDHPDADWLPFEAARDRIQSRVVPLAAETADTGAAAGRVLSADIHAPSTLPPWDNSGMDGYAVRSEDVQDCSAETPADLAVVGGSYPGEPWIAPVAPGTAVRIMTGGPVPPGADTIIRVEDTRTAGSDRVQVLAAPAPGRHIRPAGEDMKAGQLILPEGTLLEAGALTVLEGAGLHRVPVRRRPRVGVLTTGDELDEVGPGIDPWSDNRIPDTNGPMLCRLAESAGAEAVPLGIARDSDEALDQALARAIGADLDVLVTTGGASMGEADLVKSALDRSGFILTFWRTRIRPGSPFSFGELPRPDGGGLPGQDHPVFTFGLPGNPVSAFVTFQLFVRPFLLGLAGASRVHRPVVTARLEGSLSGARDLAVFLRVTLDAGAEGLVARSTGPQGSGLLHSLGVADGLAVLPRGVAGLEDGDPVRVILLGDGLRPTPRVHLDPE
jgi:molybdopterin molybdotransferase